MVEPGIRKGLSPRKGKEAGSLITMVYTLVSVTVPPPAGSSCGDGNILGAGYTGGPANFTCGNIDGKPGG